MKKLIKFCTMLLVCIALSTAVAGAGKLSVYAYTDEEKAAAKAWLSANGYSPTMSGAEQAYSDYLNGKWGPVGGQDTPTPTPEPETAPAEIQTVDQAAVEAKESAKKVVEVLQTETELESESEKISEEETTQEETTVTEETSETETTTPVESETETQSTSEEAAEQNESNGIVAVICVLAALVCVALILITGDYCRRNKNKKNGQ